MASSSATYLSEQYVGLVSWWQRHNKNFSLWYLSQELSVQREILLRCCPDMPALTPASRELYTAQDITASDMLIPELTQEALLSNQGKLLILLITRRLVSPDSCIVSDAKFLEGKFISGTLPRFPEAEEAFKDMDTPFLDPNDPREMIHCLDPATTTPAVRENILQLISEGKAVRAQTWIAMKVRRSALENFIRSLFCECEENITPKLAPSLAGLIEAERQQRQYISATESESVAVPESCEDNST